MMYEHSSSRPHFEGSAASCAWSAGHEVHVAMVRLEAAQRERAVEIDSDEAVAQDRPHPGQQLLQERVTSG